MSSINHPVIEVKDLHVTFKTKNKEVEIIRGVSYDIFQNEIVGFIGESGSGKSVTAKSLLNINNTSNTRSKVMKVKGTSLLSHKSKDDESDLLHMNLSKGLWKQVRGKKIAYIPQDAMTSLNPTTRIHKQIIESLKLHFVPREIEKIKSKYSENKNQDSNKKMKEEIANIKSNKFLFDRAVEFLEKFGISNAKERIKSYPHEFSGGMRQRALIAMTIACYPDVIIADEPTTALDPTIQSQILQMLMKIRDEFNISIIFISHDIGVISTICDRINVFYAGRIVETGKKEEIFSNPRHPYTWSLLSAMPDGNDTSKRLFTIPGTPPDFSNLPQGDPFSVRNPYAMKIDFIKEPPLIKVTDTHYAATWLLHPSSPKVEMPDRTKKVIAEFKKSIGK